jgi:diacylglycerol kinase family enzyme
MERLWLISNAQSGSTSQSKCAAIEAICHERGLTLVRHSRFPDDDLPDEVGLAAERIDTVVLFAGDGTINACLCTLANWQGSILILPGGTMNLLAKALHGNREPEDIIHAAHASPVRVARPYIEAGSSRAFVAVILGPAAHWADVREAARKGLYSRLFRFTVRAWRRTFRQAVRITGVAGMRRGYQAIFVTPGEEGMRVAAVDARDWRTIIDLGWEWLRGDWVAARGVEEKPATSFWTSGKRPVLALFDGEGITIAPGTSFISGRSAEVFLATEPEAE